MRWIAKEIAPPQYVWLEDEWYNETDKSVYRPVLETLSWNNGIRSIQFPKKTKIMSPVNGQS